VRIFRSDDGAELREEDVRGILGFCELATDASDRIVAALVPKTCGCEMTWNDSGQTFVVGRCVLPPGHHPWTPSHYAKDIRACCPRPATDPIHSPGHMTAPECWRESVPAGGSFRVSLETEVNTKP
jgi:hypothetical protein